MRSNEARGGPVRRFPDRSAAETASHYSDEFRSPISRWGLSEKLRPTLKRQNGMRFPVEVSSGKRIPESAAETGHDFPNGPLAETAARNLCPKRDAVSPRAESAARPSSKSSAFLRCMRNIQGVSQSAGTIGTFPAAGSISPQLQKPAQATVFTCAGLVGAHKGTLQRPTSVMDYRTAPARDASVDLPSDEACRSPRQSAQCRQSADTAK